MRYEQHGALGVVRPSAEGGCDGFSSSVEETVGWLSAVGCEAIALSFRDLKADHTVCTGILVICHQVVRRHGYDFYVLRQETPAMISLEEICRFLDIVILESAEHYHHIQLSGGNDEQSSIEKAG